MHMRRGVESGAGKKLPGLHAHFVALERVLHGPTCPLRLSWPPRRAQPPSLPRGMD